ncbi:MAG TPA: tRNA (cytidine(34)-2'-O)-methyltransferase [Candidatus Babeliaceae bacterium]|nr:tRNA (cytidine(34)-2'-O)-methyltransferase [Candidatus Babeliaceae bacterium]
MGDGVPEEQSSLGWEEEDRLGKVVASPNSHFRNRRSIVLFQPQIPQNTGNIVRTCAVTGSDLILVRPLGFKTTDRWLKRAGLDYWEGVHVSFLDDLEKYVEGLQVPFYFFSSKATKYYTQIDYSMDDHLIFGSETAGLPLHFHQKWANNFYKIPMKEGPRCLNLSNAAAVVIYEAWRQQNFH